MRGNGPGDGQVTFNSDDSYIDYDYSEVIDEKYWCLNYNDEVAPAISDIELSDGTHRALTQDEINTFGALAEKLFTEAETAVKDDEERQQKLDDEAWMRDYTTWTVGIKKSRDELLSLSDPYVLLSNLDDTGWETWRQWVRDLPQQYDAPMKIDSWTEPPTNANNLVAEVYTNFKIRCETAKKLYDHYNP